MASLPMSEIVNVIVRTGPVAARTAGLNIGLLIGKSTVIPISERVRKYSSIAAMIDDGFAIESPEIKGATLYFGQSPRPSSICIARRDEYETVVEALAAARLANGEWYAVSVLDATIAEIEAIAGYVETAGVENPMVQMFTSNDEEAIIDGGIFSDMKALQYRRSFGQYSLTPYAVCSIMGYAMGANNGAANSSYTLNLKPTPGVVPEPLTESQYDMIRKNNGNVVVSRGGKFTILQEGTMASGVFFDEVIGLDLTAMQIQNAVMNLLTGTAKIPQTEDGVSRIASVVIPPCEAARVRGFIASGVWTGDPVLDLQPGDTVDAGYYIQSQKIADQSIEDREARKAPYIYVALKLAGAIHSATIMVDVNR